MSLLGTPLHINGTVDGTGDTFKFSGKSSQLISYIVNTHPSNTLFISFDGGVTFTDLPPNGGVVEDLPISRYDFFAKGSAAGTTFQALVVV